MNKVKLKIIGRTIIDQEQENCHGAKFNVELSADEPLNDCCSEAIVITMLCQLLSDMTDIDVAAALKMQRDIDNLIENQ